jgi:hypothetical protein
MIYIKTIVLFFTMLMLSNNLYSQSGMRFPELEKRLEPYFADDLIADIRKELPQSVNYTIWGWDVGDFSGDGYYDVAITVRIAGEKGNKMQVYLFVDIDGYLTKVAQYPYEYFELPLEIGVVIKSGTCYITKKIKEFNWIIRGYRYDNGVIVVYDEFKTRKIGNYTYETLNNFSTLQYDERYLETATGREIMSANYLNIISYPRSKQIYKGYAEETYSDYVDYVRKGAYHWDGYDDCSFIVKSAYDENFLYFVITVFDQNVIAHNYEYYPADNVSLWFDINYIGKQHHRLIDTSKKEIAYRTNAEYGIFNFVVYPGDFFDRRAYVKEICSTDDLYYFQQDAVESIRVVSSLMDDSYQLKIRIPFLLFGLEKAPIKNNEITEIGCTIVVSDIDNEYRPEEETEIATSNFNHNNPATYGALLLIPDGMWYGNATNIYTEYILSHLKDLGF